MLALTVFHALLALGVGVVVAFVRWGRKEI